MKTKIQNVKELLKILGMKVRQYKNKEENTFKGVRTVRFIDQPINLGIYMSSFSSLKILETGVISGDTVEEIAVQRGTFRKQQSQD